MVKSHAKRQSTTHSSLPSPKTEIIISRLKERVKWMYTCIIHLPPFHHHAILTLKTGVPARLSSLEVIHTLVLLDSGSSHLSSVSFCVILSFHFHFYF